MLQASQQQPSSAAAKVKRWLSGYLNQLSKVRGFLSAVSSKFSPIPSYKAVMPNLWLLHIRSAPFSLCLAKFVDCIWHPTHPRSRPAVCVIRMSVGGTWCQRIRLVGGCGPKLIVCLLLLRLLWNLHLHVFQVH